jgi:putative transposase
MSREGYPWDNAIAASFFSSLKKESVKKQIYDNRELALTDVADYIERCYNRTRRHSHLCGISRAFVKKCVIGVRRRAVLECWG